MTDLIVNLSVKDTIKKMTEKIDSSMSGTVLDYHPLPSGGAVIVYEKYYYRAENMLTLTAVVYPEDTNTHVHLVSGGGGSAEVLVQKAGGALPASAQCHVHSS